MKTFLLITLCHASLVLGQCWKKNYSRGVGVPVSQCRAGLQQSGLLCYDPCRAGYGGVGPVCWQFCAEGWTDRGAFCWIDVHIYGKGCCCSSFTPECCNSCEAGYTDDGCTCRKDAQGYPKKTEGRGLGSALTCADSQEYDAGLCYDKCQAGYRGIATICYQTCQGSTPYDCGAFCAPTAESCASEIMRLVASGIGVFGSMGQLIVAGTDTLLNVAGVVGLSGSGAYFASVASRIPIGCQAAKKTAFQNVFNQLQYQHTSRLENLKNQSLTDMEQTNINDLRTIYNNTKQLLPTDSQTLNTTLLI